MKKYITACLVLLLAMGYQQRANAQYYYDGRGKMIESSSEVEGSPFENDNWTYGSATDIKGVVYKNIRLKYDLYNDRLMFANMVNEMMVFVNPVLSFVYNGDTYANGFPAVAKFTDSTYYKIISDGKTKLLYHHSKALQSVKVYDSAVVHYRLFDKEVYYLLKDDKMIEVKPSKGSLLSAMKDKSAQMNLYFGSHADAVKSTAGLAEMMTYYNSL
jgi:hypothetical protein